MKPRCPLTNDPSTMFVCPKSIVLIVCAVVILHGNFVRSEKEYCDIESCSPGQHTLCLYPNSEPGPNCNGRILYPLMANDVNEILRFHNFYRKLIAAGQRLNVYEKILPTATNMNELKWDDDLEKVAQRWANQCLSGRDSCRNLPKYLVGQNVGTECSRHNRDFAVHSIMNHFWSGDAPQRLTKDEINSYRTNPKTAGYTQIIWAKTTHVGCAAVTFKSGEKTCSTLVCNYGPAGDRVGEPIYEIGPSASRCPDGTGTYEGLCK